MMIRKTILAFLIGTANIAAYSQGAQQEINDQVWKPFTQAITTQDVSTFIQLHSKDVMRVERDQKHILNYDQYKKDLELSWQGWRESMKLDKSKYTFELRFLERTSTENQAFEVGYFKGEIVNSKGEKSASYGQFHVALRKENGVWKILVDSDSKNGGTITEAMFQAAKSLE